MFIFSQIIFNCSNYRDFIIINNLKTKYVCILKITFFSNSFQVSNSIHYSVLFLYSDYILCNVRLGKCLVIVTHGICVGILNKIKYFAFVTKKCYVTYDKK